MQQEQYKPFRENHRSMNVGSPAHHDHDQDERKFIDDYQKNVFLRWQAPEFEMLERDKKRLSYATLILLVIIVYATFTDNPIMAIVFVLIGIVAYLYMGQAPRTLDFSITSKGIAADNQIYEFSDLRSFWIFYDPRYKKVISLHTKSLLLPFAHIPIEDEDPVAIRRILIKYIPEIKQEHNFSETLERFLGI